MKYLPNTSWILTEHFIYKSHQQITSFNLSKLPVLHLNPNFVVVCLCVFFFHSSANAEKVVQVEGAECQHPIEKIEISGNKSTKESVFIQELAIQVGEVCSIEAILETRQNFMDLGIFSSVKPSLEGVEGGLILQFQVEEKYFILPIPRISRTSDGEVRLGIQLRMDNVAGLNHQLKFTSEKHAEEDGAGRKGFEHTFAYKVPRFANSRYGMSVKLVHLEKQNQLKRDGMEFGESDRSSDKIEIGLNRRKHRVGGLKGWQNRFNLSYEIRGHNVTEGELGPFEEGENLRVSAGVKYDQVHLEKYRRSGFALGGDISAGIDILGADYQYQRFDAFYRSYIPLDAPTLTNFNYNMVFGITNGTPFGERAFSLGGGDTLRGLSGRTVDGDVRLLVNMEYLSALKINPALRWVLFWDVANIFPRWKFKPARTENGLGFGLRWKVVSFVKLDLRLDYAISLSEKKGFAYLATKLNF